MMATLLAETCRISLYVGTLVCICWYHDCIYSIIARIMAHIEHVYIAIVYSFPARGKCIFALHYFIKINAVVVDL